MKFHEVPRFLTLNPTTSTHSIVIADPTDDVHPYTILLQLEGIMRYFQYILPTSAKYENKNFSKLELMAACLAWNPLDDDHTLQEERHLDYRGHLISAACTDGPCWNPDPGWWLRANANRMEEPTWALSRVPM